MSGVKEEGGRNMTMVNGRHKSYDHKMHHGHSSDQGSASESINNILQNRQHQRKLKEDEKLMSQIVSDADDESKLISFN
jgi:hypothetical protein